MSGIAGLRGTGNWGTDERPKDFRESILFFRPAGTAPIFGLTSKAGKKTVKDPEFAWWAEGQNIKRFTISGALAAGDTLATISSFDPTSTTLSVPYGTATHLKPGDLLLVAQSNAGLPQVAWQTQDFQCGVNLEQQWLVLPIQKMGMCPDA